MPLTDILYLVKILMVHLVKNGETEIRRIIQIKVGQKQES